MVGVAKKPGASVLWLSAALVSLPTVDGVPDARCRENLLALLLSFPDPLTNGTSFNLGLIEGLRNVLCEFARVCRRMQSASAFDVAAYEWVSIKS